MIEQAPVWREDEERGVVAEGAVGVRAFGRLPLFRYEVRRWREGLIPDIDEAVESPQRLSDDPDCARRLLELVPEVPTPVWGRDELRAGEMWNSNSTISWLIARSGLDVESIELPRGGRAPGWEAGIVVARRQQTGDGRDASPASGDGVRSEGHGHGDADEGTRPGERTRSRPYHVVRTPRPRAAGFGALAVFVALAYALSWAWIAPFVLAGE